MSHVGSSYGVLRADTDPLYCAIHDLPNELADPEGPAIGEVVGADHVDGQEFRMADAVQGMMVPDVIRNSLSYFMVSDRMKELLQQHSGANIEFLRFTLLNHKGRISSDRCFIANVLGTVDCVDRDLSSGEDDPLEDGQWMWVDKLNLDSRRIPEDRRLFRIRECPSLIVLRSDLRSLFEDARVTGVRYFALGEQLPRR